MESLRTAAIKNGEVTFSTKRIYEAPTPPTVTAYWSTDCGRAGQ
ncbi:hypothetical protein L833_4852 [Mycobacteroides abscessus MAB_091912_2446]|uniref:Uncharacterized protein n=1 Tax=Mycobacteroides abscessus MAB_091912_2446 TaxID=1335414 RepID=A0A829MBQ0_9MYCO|nr:hypothetical protein L833_4852 [Mycobacteroides abscessus MAB_091912_2446]